MSDQYNSQRPTPPRPSAVGTGQTLSGTEPSRSDVRVDVSSPPLARGGFSTGLLVAIVFVVVAIIAAAVFGNRDAFGVGDGGSPDVSIENNSTAPVEAVPAETAPATDAPAATTVDPVAPTPAPAPEPAPAPADPATPAVPPANP